MTKIFAAKRLQLGLATWAAETTDPNAGLGTIGGIGSWWQRQGASPSTPNELYLKLNATDQGWVHQNLINVNIFNIKDYGAVGDGVTNDLTAIRNTVTACAAAGGGLIYIPATPNFYSVSSLDINLIELLQKSNITFLGDGYASKIKQTGSVGGGESHVFGVRNDCRNIKFYNFYIDAANITNPDPAEQNHGIQIDATSATGTTGPQDITIENMYFGRFPGDAIRILGGSTRPIGDIRIRRSAMDLRTGNAAGARAGLSVQRFTRRVIFHHNWITGSHDQQIDFEPTGIPVGGPGLGGPSQYSIIGTLMDHQSQISDAVTLTGEGGVIYQQGIQNLYAYNILNNGGAVSGRQMNGYGITGNIVDFNNTATDADGSALDFFENTIYCRFASNISSTASAAATKRALSLKSDPTFTPSHNTIRDNILRSKNVGVGGQSTLSSSSLETTIEGNICQQNTDVAAQGAGISFEHASCVIGNLISNINLRLSAGLVSDSSSTSPLTMTHQNLVIGPVQSTVKLNTPGPYPNVIVSGNSCSDVSSSGINNSNRPTLVDGNAPGNFVGQIALAAGPNNQQSSAIGSIMLTTLGTQNQALWWKEIGAITSTTGWVVYGGTDLTFGALSGSTAIANRFFAPGGLDLAVESSVEIQVAIPRPARIRNLRMRCTAGTGGGNNTYRFRKNSADVALQVTVVNTATTGTDTTNSFTVVAGDLVSCRVSKTVAPTTPQTNILVSCEIV